MSQVFGCAKCRVPLLILDQEPRHDDTMQCPVCGIVEDADVISREIAAYAAEEAARSVADAMQAFLGDRQPDARLPMQRSRRTFRFIPVPRED